MAASTTVSALVLSILELLSNNPSSLKYSYDIITPTLTSNVLRDSAAYGYDEGDRRAEIFVNDFSKCKRQMINNNSFAVVTQQFKQTFKEIYYYNLDGYREDKKPMWSEVTTQTRTILLVATGNGTETVPVEINEAEQKALQKYFVCKPTTIDKNTFTIK